jgi:branched-chain amino acid aminotransferase
MEIFLNGEFIQEEDAKVSVFDRGFLYGDGVFETLRVYNGKPFLLDRHLGRLAHSLGGLYIKDPYDFEQWYEYIKELMVRNNAKENILRIQVSRGVGKRGYTSSGNYSPTAVISLHDPPPLIDKHHQLDLITASRILTDHDPLSTLKTSNKLVNIIAMREAERAEAHDAVLLNGQGYTTETSSSNIFIVLEGKLYTPPLSSGCLSGITRGYVLELAAELGIDALQKDLELEQLENSEGFFLTNSTQEIQPVKSLNGATINQSPVTSELQKIYRQKVTSATK